MICLSLIPQSQGKNDDALHVCFFHFNFVNRSLRSLLDYEGNDVEDVFALNFTVTIDYFGEMVVKPLKANGENISVTSENK